MLFTYLHFKRVIDGANLMAHLYNASTYGDRDRTTILKKLNIRVDANLFKKEKGGMDTFSAMERGSKTIFDVLLTVDRFGNPFILAESMTIFVRGENKIYINDVTMNTKMLTQIVEYILEQSWSPGMTLTEKLFEAIVHGSMAKDYQFTQANVKGCGSFAAWRIFDMPMFEHAFFTYGIEIYITEAREYGDLETVVTFFGPLSREEDSVFYQDKPYGIVSILTMLDNEDYPIHEEETVIEQIDVLSALLEETLHIPKLHMLVLPEMVDELPIDELPALFSFSPQAMTPIGALLTVANVEANALVTPDLPTARRLNF
jgi:hypothetical protein